MPGLPMPAAADAGAADAGAADAGAADDGAAETRDDVTEGYDWSQAENELRDVLPAMFVGEESVSAGLDEASAYDAEHTGLTLADVAGLDEVKKRLEAAFLAPMRNPELRKLYGKSLRGGLLLYGPPGCGKTFIARAVAGELGARFITVSFADLIDMFVGRSERNIHELFEVARRNAPCVVFLDEVDAIGQKRSQLRNTPMRSAVNQLLLELDDVASDNTGVFLLAATNHPWDVDSALRRPGRFDRTLLVLPPDGHGARGRVPLPPAGPAGGRDRPGQAVAADRRVLGRGHRARLRDGGGVGAARLGAHRRAAADRPGGPRGGRRGGQAVARHLVRDRAERGAVRQRRRRIR